VLGIRDAEHEETAPQASHLLISRLACSLADKTGIVKIVPGTLADRLYGKEEVTEQFRCSYGLNPEYREIINRGELRIAGFDPEGEARIVELSRHHFFLATLFLPQLSSTPILPHPLIIGYMRAALEYQISTDRENSMK
jgi:CTP synthase (UTP-ammonia lyase)